MSKMHKVWVILVALFVLPVCGLAQNEPIQADSFLGELSGGKYRNDFFGFTLTPLPEMYVFSGDERNSYKKAGVELISKDIEKGRAAFEKAAGQEVLIFSVAMAKPELRGISSLNVGALKQPAGATPSLVCDTAAEFLVRNPSFTVTSKTATLKRRGKDFARIEFAFASGDQKLSLRYYATIQNGYSITFVITHLSKTDLDAFEKVLDSLDFP